MGNHIMPSTYDAPLIKASFPSDGVLVLALARPPVNAFSTSLFHQLEDSFRAASSDSDVRCIVLTSEVDKGFTAGLELTMKVLPQTQVCGGSLSPSRPPC